MTDTFEKAWWDSLNTQKRDRPELGTISLDGVNAYPLENMKGELNTFREDWRNYPEGDKKERPFNISAFRNLANAGHISPGRLPSGDIRRDTGVLTVKRNFPKIGDSLTSIANFLPLRDPHFDVNRTAQRNAYVLREKDPRKNPQRTEHLWSRGNLEHQELMDLIEGKRSPQEILGMNQEIVLDRNQYGDAQVSWNQGGQAIEAPRFGYDVYDIIDRSLGRNRFQFDNRKYRDDAGHPWRKPLDYKVSGSVDPLLKIPLQFAQNEAPDRVRDSIQQGGGRYLEYVDPSGHRFEGVPVPMNLTGDLRPALSRGISTGTHGIYFDPRDLTNAGLESWDAALSGDVIRRALESIQIRDEMSLEKMPHPAHRRIKEGQPLPTPLPIQGVKNAKMYGEIMMAIRDVLGERDTYEPFAGMGGLSHQYQAKRAILNDINPDLGRFNRSIIQKPMKIDVSQQNLKEGDPILFPHDELGMMNLGQMTPELANYFGEGQETFLPAHYYKIRHDFNQLREKEKAGVATDQDIDEMNAKFYLLQQMGMNGLVRYSPSAALPSLDIPYSVSPGKRGKTPVHQPIEDAFFNQFMDAGLATTDDPKGYRYTGRSPSAGSYRLMKPGGNLARPQKMKGQGGIHDFAPWHEPMKDWEYRTGSAFDFYDDIKEQMTPEKSQFVVDSPYFGEQGAHNHFLEPEQKRLIEQLIDAKDRGIPTSVFNSYHPSIVQPLEQAGFTIHKIPRQERANSKASGRGVVDEMLAMANFDQDAFQTAWEHRKNPQPAQRTLFD